MADTDTARARGKFSDEGLYSIGTRYAPLGNWKPLLENETSLPTSWSAAIIHVRLFFHCVRVWLQIFWRATLLKMSFSHSLFFFYYYYSFFRLFSFHFPFLFSFFFSISFVFASFSDFPRSFLFPFLSFLFSFSFFLSIYLSIHPSIPRTMDNFRSPRRDGFANGRIISILPRRSRKRMKFFHRLPLQLACFLLETILFLLSFLIFFFFSSSIVPRDRESLLKFRIACKYFQISNSFKIFRKEKRRKGSWSRKDREVLFIYFFFRFPLFRQILEIFFKIREDRRENACKRERRQEGSKRHAPFLPTTPRLSSETVSRTIIIIIDAYL